MKEVTKTSLKEEVEKIKACGREKDKRIKKLESYFWWRNRLLLSIGAGLGFCLPWILFIMYAKPISVELSALIPAYYAASAIIGIITLMILTLVGAVLVFLKIWE